MTGPSAEAIARVRRGRNPLYPAFDAPDDAIALAPLLEAASEARITSVISGLIQADGIGVIARHLADVAALATLDDELAGRWLRRIYGRDLA